MEIAVAGCGPAGLAAALLLRRDGHRVTLFERFPEPQPIGSGLMVQPTGLAVLRELGLEGATLAAGARINRLYGQSGARTVLDVRYAALGTQGGFGIGIHRAALFDLLHGAVRAKAIPIATDHAVAGSTLGADGRRHLVFRGGASAGPFDLVVDALGSHSTLAPAGGRTLAYGALWATLDWPAAGGFAADTLVQRYRAASVMAGVLPLGAAKAALFWSLRTDQLEAWRAQGLAAWKAEVAALWPDAAPLLAQIAAPGQLTFARYAHRTLARPAEAGLIHIGDAWHCASPQLGQGANMALLDAYALAAALRRESELGAAQLGTAHLGKALARAVRMRRRHVRIYQAMTALLTPVYQSDSRVLPWLRDRMVGPLSLVWPATWLQAAMVSGLIGDPLRALGLRRAPL